MNNILRKNAWVLIGLILGALVGLALKAWAWWGQFHAATWYMLVFWYAALGGFIGVICHAIAGVVQSFRRRRD